ncbi:hypothetical protein [Tateyamaria sp. ANG-S1]|uniref:hypothetical protein n=1 Tax=Tateyamaria sp. ANG-S1 TaxID=1577905 RepID=UPI00057F3D60|nr:hypothetical protein [Tateyamaria sp. ANG-S1]KIC47933.1 hypothetical protein RA29_17090 [Tateyamaria sp. ANG-S1]
MTDTLTVPAHERGVIRVFALSMTDKEAQVLKDDPAALNDALGTGVNADQVEVFPVSDLEGIGLVGYLVEGNAVPMEQLGPDRSKLEKLGGWVLIVFSLAFEDRAATLRPASSLTLIGTYGELRTDWSAAEKIETDSAKPYSAPPETVKKKPSDAAMSGRIAMVALIVLGLLTYLMIWIGG